MSVHVIPSKLQELDPAVDFFVNNLPSDDFVDSAFSLQDPDPYLCRDSGLELEKRIHTSQKEAPVSKPGLHISQGYDETGIRLEDTLLDPIEGQYLETATHVGHVRSFSDFEPGDTAILPRLLTQPELPPPGALDRQLRSSRRSQFETEDTASIVKTQLHSSRQSEFEPEEATQTKKARTAARCWHNNKTTLRLKDDLRERNRVAAAKHRVKKREAIDSLEENVRTAGAENKVLEQEVRLLREQLTHWRTLALQHLPGEGGCRCAAMHVYNAAKVDQLVNGVEDAALLLPRPPTPQASFF